MQRSIDNTFVCFTNPETQENVFVSIANLMESGAPVLNDGSGDEMPCTSSELFRPVRDESGHEMEIQAGEDGSNMVPV